MECFGSFNPDICTRDKCEFFDSCKYYAADTRRESRNENEIIYHKKVENVRNDDSAGLEDFYAILNPVGFDYDYDTPQKEETFTLSQVIAVIAYIMRLKRDVVVWNILKDRMRGSRRSLASYARECGVTRQALHKRVGKALANLLEYKTRKHLTDSRLLTLTPKEFHLLKLQELYDSEQEIMQELNMHNVTQFRTLQKSLEHKLYRFT